MNMNINPWVIQALVEYERDRILHDMQQIRLEEEAMQAERVVEDIATTRLSRSRRLMLIVSTLIQWMLSVRG